MLNLDVGKLLVIGVVALIVLGPDRLPRAARHVGSFWRALNEQRQRMESEVRKTVPDLPSSVELARLARSPGALLDHLGSMAADKHPSGRSIAPDNMSADKDLPDLYDPDGLTTLDGAGTLDYPIRATLGDTQATASPSNSTRNDATLN